TTLFGYPVSDTAGNMALHTLASPADSARSAADWITFYPRRLRIEPGGRRTVRILVTPPDNVTPGEYWSRIVVTARGTPAPLSSGQGITLGLNAEVRQIIAFFYRKGRLTTGVRIDSVVAARQGDSLVVRPNLTRLGTGAFIGTFKAILRDGSGQTL